MRLFANPEAEKWKDTAHQWQEASNQLQRQLSDADAEIRRLQQQVHQLQQQNYQLSQQKENEHPFDRSQLRLVLEILQRIPKSIKPLRKLTTKSGMNIILLDKEKVEATIREFGKDPKSIIPKLAMLGLIERQEGFQYAFRMDGSVVRGYALLNERARWYVHDAMKPLAEEEE